MKKLTFKKGGIHPPENKLTSGKPITVVPLPAEVTLCFSQHLGKPAACALKKGDRVCRGQLVANSSGFISANIHTPITGTVTKIDKAKNAFGFPVDTITITSEEADRVADAEALASRRPVRSVDEAMQLTPDEIKAMVESAGIVGLGGATFPTKVKLSPPPGSKADVLIVNGAECEPFLTCDQALMEAVPGEIIAGVELVMRAAGVERALIGIEENKPGAIEALTRAAAGHPGVKVCALKMKYPQGGEKQLIAALTGREVPSGQLPVSVGAIVQNVATVHAIYNAVVYGEPLLDRVVTVTGPSVTQPGNFRVPLGTSLRSLVDLAGGIPEDTGKIILGGPMMGKAVVSVDTPTTKGISGVLMLPGRESKRAAVEPCIRCGRCIEACPMGLQPNMLATYGRLGRIDDLKEEGVQDCMECGSCSYTCPAARPLLDYIRVGKAAIRK